MPRAVLIYGGITCRNCKRSPPQVVLVDGKDLFWWGRRTRGGLERLGLVWGDL